MTEILSHDLIPYEIKLIEKLRIQHNKEVFKVSHPLLETELYDIPKEALTWDLEYDEIYQYLLSKEALYQK